MHLLINSYFKFSLNIDSRVSFTDDNWTSRYRIYPYMGITAHFINNDWQLMDVGLSLCPLEGPHMGDNMSETFLDNVEKRFGIFDKVILYI